MLALSRLLTGNIIEGFQVQAKGTPDMTVTVGQGTAGIPTGTYPSSYHSWIANNTTTGTPAGESVTITTASASNPRIDTIVAYINEGASFNTSPVNFPGGFTLAAVAGTPAGSPSAPSGATIQSAVGGANPYIVLADVLVGTSVTQINSGNITDRRTWATTSARNLSNPYKFSVYANTTVAISSTTQKVALNVENFDTNSNFDSTTNYRYTAPVAGFYRFDGQAWFGNSGASTSEWAEVKLYKNGSSVRGSDRMNGSGDTARLPIGKVGGLLQLAAGDYIELYVVTGGVYRDIVAGSASTFLDGWLESIT